jgi:hypothetical protein
MQTSKVRNALFVMLGLFFLIACTSKTIQYPETPPVPVDTISFSQAVIPIFDAGCNSSCHAAGGVAPDLSAAHAYNSLVPAFVNLASPSSSIIYTVVIPGGSMHVYFPSDKDPNTILGWIQQGAKNN